MVTSIFHHTRMRTMILFSMLVPFFSIYGQYISCQLPVDSSGVGKILRYNHNASIQDDIEYVNRRINERVYFETHVGGAYYLKLKERAIVGVKFNIINPKQPYCNVIKAKIFKIRQLAQTQYGGMDPVSSSRLNEIEQELIAYEKNKWKRISISAIIPVASSIFDDRYYDSFNARFMNKLGVAIGYDIADHATVSVGSNIRHMSEFFGAVSFDLSTPTYIAAIGFLGNLKTLLYPRLSGPGSVDSYYN